MTSFSVSDYQPLPFRTQNVLIVELYAARGKIVLCNIGLSLVSLS
jgi:hypothetical protein